MDIIYGSGKNILKVIFDLNMNIYKGEIFLLVGELGSGKLIIGLVLVVLILYSFGLIIIGSEILLYKII